MRRDIKFRFIDVPTKVVAPVPVAQPPTRPPKSVSVQQVPSIPTEPKAKVFHADGCYGKDLLLTSHPFRLPVSFLCRDSLHI